MPYGASTGAISRNFKAHARSIGDLDAQLNAHVHTCKGHGGKKMPFVAATTAHTTPTMPLFLFCIARRAETFLLNHNVPTAPEHDGQPDHKEKGLLLLDLTRHSTPDIPARPAPSHGQPSLPHLSCGAPLRLPPHPDGFAPSAPRLEFKW